VKGFRTGHEAYEVGEIDSLFRLESGRSWTKGGGEAARDRSSRKQEDSIRRSENGKEDVASPEKGGAGVENVGADGFQQSGDEKGITEWAVWFSRTRRRYQCKDVF